MAQDIGRTRCKNMYVMRSNTLAISIGEEASSANAIFPSRFKPCANHLIRSLIQRLGPGHLDEYIDHRFGVNSGYRCAANMMNFTGTIAPDIPQNPARRVELGGPIGIVGSRRLADRLHS